MEDEKYLDVSVERLRSKSYIKVTSPRNSGKTLYIKSLYLIDHIFKIYNSILSLRFDTKDSVHGFVYSDQFIQIVFNLRDYKHIYGFGENTHHSFKHQFSYDNWWAIFGRDQPTGGKMNNLYGAHPFFMAVNDQGRAFGLLILNSNAQEYGFLPPTSVAYRTMGGILDLYIMEEATPEALIQTYTQLIGTPYLPP